jgi:hypothetical protein
MLNKKFPQAIKMAHHPKLHIISLDPLYLRLICVFSIVFTPRFPMLPSIEQRLATELAAQPHQVAAAIALLDEGSTVPSIARYRKEAMLVNFGPHVDRPVIEMLAHALSGPAEQLAKWWIEKIGKSLLTRLCD